MDQGTAADAAARSAGAGPGPESEGVAQPADFQMIQRLLQSMGVDEWEPRVVNMLMDFMYRYVTDVVQDAEVFSEHIGRPLGQIDMSGLMLAVQSRAAFNFAQPPPLDVVASMADTINAVPLEDAPLRPGLPLPPDNKQLTAPNYQYEPVQPQ